MSQRRKSHPPPAALARLAARAKLCFNGPRPWDVQVHAPAFYRRVLAQGSLGLGETYVEGLWDAEALDETLTRLIRAGAPDQLPWQAALHAGLAWLGAATGNRQPAGRNAAVRRHYDLGDDLYRAMLGPSMVYSGGYWEHAETLEEAQRAKLDLICRKLALAPGERLLDIGCGWGALAEHAARHYGAVVLGVTISPAQLRHAHARCRDLPVTIRLQDYRQIEGRFDKIACVGMFEHVGQARYRRFFQQAAGLLAADGLFLLHTVGSRISTRGTDPWVHRYVFPHAAIPSARQLTAALEPDWVLEDWHSFGADYERTLRAWWGNVAAAWPALDPGRYDARFQRLWRYYLHAFMGYFRARRGQLWQLVLSRPTRARVWRRPVMLPPWVHASPEDAEPALPLTGSPAMSHPGAAVPMRAASTSP